MKPITVIFDGHELTNRFVCMDITRPLMGSPTLTTRDVPGADGTLVLASRLQPYDVTIRLAAIDHTAEGMRDAFRMLSAWMACKSEGKLWFSDEPGLYRLAWPSKADDVETLGITNGQTDVTFRVAKPWLYGSTHRVASSGGRASFLVSGTIAAPALVESKAASGDFLIRDSVSGGKSRVSVGGTAKALVIDGETRSVTVGGASAMMTLDSDWPSLAPGRHVITRDGGAGDFTISWQERWYG